VASISFNKSGVVVTNNGGSFEYLFTENDSFTYEFRDEAGNTGTLTATVNRIDKVAPRAVSLDYTPQTATNTDVLATIAFSEAIQTPATWTKISEKVFTKIFTENASETLTFSDFVGNAGSTGVAVNRIDKSTIIPTLTYSPATATSGNVQASISFNKSGVQITNNS
jgi:hypothetical protein